MMTTMRRNERLGPGWTRRTVVENFAFTEVFEDTLSWICLGERVPCRLLRVFWGRKKAAAVASWNFIEDGPERFLSS
jgi:hypothetical protein